MLVTVKGISTRNRVLRRVDLGESISIRENSKSTPVESPEPKNQGNDSRVVELIPALTV